MRLELRQPVRCTDDVLGELADVVIDPVTRRITHLVVEPSHHGVARLVPVELAAREEDGPEIALRCSTADVERLAAVRETAFLRLGETPVEDPEWDVGIEDVLALPYYPLDGPADPLESAAVVYDRIPKGEVEIQRASAVLSSDGHDVGKVDGFVIDGETQAITHVVLERGHLWGRRDVTIPVGAVASVEIDVVRLTLSKEEVGELPAVRVRRHG
ncbi:MAG TPA: PRC-barrel domain-containing protein [Solirubrobacteraceae bacterium]|jgi:sporulation protein YlmC with PRC-barrel domain